MATSERIIFSLLGFTRPKLPILRKVAINKVARDALSGAAVAENIEVVSELGEGNNFTVRLPVGRGE